MSTVKKERIDKILVAQGHYDTVKQAQSAVMAGLVFIDHERIEKAGMLVSPGANIEVKGATHPYVSRGGLKLEKALNHFHIELNGAVVLDIGASTGGFTDCALQHGAAYVYAIDVGYNQLAWSLRNSPRVNVMERTNFRYVTRDHLTGPEPNVGTIDVSFISLDKILPPLRQLMASGSQVIALIKPQFEAPKHRVGEAGIVTDRSVHRDVLQDVLYFAAQHG